MSRKPSYPSSSLTTRWRVRRRPASGSCAPTVAAPSDDGNALRMYGEPVKSVLLRQHLTRRHRRHYRHRNRPICSHGFVGDELLDEVYESRMSPATSVTSSSTHVRSICSSVVPTPQL